ncbi:hypothetical protein ACFSUK_25450 [Sphingobium scionense]
MKSVVIAALAIMATTAQPLLAQADAPLPVMQAPEASPAMVLPANTAVMLRMNSELSSKTAKEGSMFDLSVADPVMVDGYVVIPMNARAVGEVTWLTGKGAFGKSGKMNIELRYIEVAGRRIPIKGSFRQEGEGNTAATIGGVIAAGVFAGFITGKTAIIPVTANCRPSPRMKSRWRRRVVLRPCWASRHRSPPATRPRPAPRHCRPPGQRRAGRWSTRRWRSTSNKPDLAVAHRTRHG